jgi:hypothetical protein
MRVRGEKAMQVLREEARIAIILSSSQQTRQGSFDARPSAHPGTSRKTPGSARGEERSLTICNR